MLILDAHNHLGAAPRNKSTVEEQMAELREAGISGIVFAPFQGPLAKTVEELNEGNREALELYAKYPDFLYPGVIVHPEFQEASLGWLKEFRRQGLVWCGENLTYVCNIPLTDGRWRPYLEFCQQEKMVFQIHNCPELAEAAPLYPELTMIGSHLNPDVIPLLVDKKNVMVDFSGMHGGLVRKTLQDAYEKFGSKRLLFGTDFPGYDALPFVMRAKRDLPQESQEAICAGNLLGLFRERGVTKVFGRAV